MKKIFVASCLAAGVLVGCGGGGGGGGTGASIPAQPAIQELKNQKVLLELKDGATDALITQPLKVAFSGDAILRELDGTSLNGKSVTTSAGLVTLDAQFTATGTSFVVQVTDAAGNGWSAGGTTITGQAGASGDQVVTLKLLRPSAAAQVNASPEPVAMATTTATVSAAGTLPAITIETAPKTVTTDNTATTTIGTAKLAVQADTRATAADGSLPVGNLTVTNTYFAPATAAAVEALPGGLSAGVSVPPASAGVFNVAPANAVIAPVGFAEFSIVDSQGKQITQFDKPITLGIDLPKSTTDQDGRVVVAGGQFPVWSFDQATGKWKYEKLGTITEKSPADPNNFSLVFETNHLSSWMASWLHESCSQEFVFTGRPAGDTTDLYVYGYYGSNPAIYGGSFGTAAARHTALDWRKGVGTLRVIDKYQRSVAYLTDVTMCGGSPVTIPVTIHPTETHRLIVSTSEACPNGENQRALPTSVMVWSHLGTEVKSSTGASHVAKAGFDILPNIQLNVSAYNARYDWWDTQFVTMNAAMEVNFKWDVDCRQVTGGASN